MEALVVAVLLVLLAGFWITQFAQLMAFEDDLMPGRYDKILWVLTFLTANVLAAAAFWLWKRVVVAARAASANDKAEIGMRGCLCGYG